MSTKRSEVQLIDQMGNNLYFQEMPQRIVCLVPSLTETLVDIGLEEKIVGITKFCVHPAHLKRKVKIIGGTKNPKIEAIKSLQPDLVIANKEENRLEDILELNKICNVYISDIKDIEYVIKYIYDMSCIFNLDTSALINRLHIVDETYFKPLISTCYLIWKDPYMSVGNDTFIHFMMEKYGFKNIFASAEGYPTCSIQEIKKLRPALVLLSSEPYPFVQSHVAELKQLLPESCIELVDGEMFSWYGTRLFPADEYLKVLKTTFGL